HPTWSMGVKITIDSATMMNKALEVIEATHLFGLPRAQIDVVVHPESIVHSLVEFRDHSIIAQLGAPDMRTPIQYALTYPQRVAGLSQRLDLSQALKLHFEPPDLERFPALRLGFEAAERGGLAGAVLNAANEAAVEQFRARAIPFGRITTIVEELLERAPHVERPTMDDIRAADAWARDEVSACCAT
ncbi:MAG: 1-deoxy-D-xylulose-5-phosphate reductoisomerase, partial [Planctomycetota bacterium]